MLIVYSVLILYMCVDTAHVVQSTCTWFKICSAACAATVHACASMS